MRPQTRRPTPRPAGRYGLHFGRGWLVPGLQGFLFALLPLDGLYLVFQALTQPWSPDVIGELPLSVDLRVGWGERWPAFIEDHDPVTLLDLGAQVLEAVRLVIPVIAVRVLFLDAGFPGVAKPSNPAIAGLRLIEPTDGVPGGGDLREFGGAQVVKGF